MTNGLNELRQLYEERSLPEGWRLYNTDTASQDPEWHWYGSLIARRQEEWFAARSAIDRALALAPQGELLAKIRFQAGDVCRYIGEYGRAREEFETTLDLLEGLPDLRSFLQGMVHYNLGLVYERLPDLSGALQHYQLARAQFAAEHMDTYLRMTLQNIAWVQADIGDATAAALALSEAAPLCNSEDALWRQRMLEARIARMLGDLTEAMRLAQWITGAAANVPADVRCLTTAIAAEIGLDLGALGPAKQLADLAVELSQQAALDSRCYQIAHKVWQKVRRAILANSGA